MFLTSQLHKFSFGAIFNSVEIEWTKKGCNFSWVLPRALEIPTGFSSFWSGVNDILIQRKYGATERTNHDEQYQRLKYTNVLHLFHIGRLNLWANGVWVGDCWLYEWRWKLEKEGCAPTCYEVSSVSSRASEGREIEPCTWKSPFTSFKCTVRVFSELFVPLIFIVQYFGAALRSISQTKCARVFDPRN